MSKKIFHIALIFTLILATAGVSVTRHYCGEKLISVNLVTEPTSCCGDASSCCHNESIHLIVNDDFVSSDQAQLPIVKTFTLDWLLSPSVRTFAIETLPQHSIALSNFEGPPLYYDNPSAFLQVFRC
ncbi:MAG: hypothetical protein PHV20_13190 [Bacteroidales bacterium]|nr:hypothetical protein [Bacteroidales bacterium]